MKRPVCVPFLFLTVAAGQSLLAADKAYCAEKRGAPNVVIVLADDLGYGDVQCNNPDRGKIPTPHIDRLAAQGMRFTDGHSSSGVCSPSRYTLLTGRYHWRTRLQSGIVGVFGAPLIAPHRLTIAGLAKQHGYRTAAVGKWHLGWEWPIPPNAVNLFHGREIAAAKTPSEAHLAAWKEVFSRSIANGPTTRGFDSYFGTDVPNWPPYCFIENDRTVGVPSCLLPRQLLTGRMASLPGPALPDWKLEPILPTLGGRAAAFITESARRPEPFLLYLPLTAPHTPLAVTDEWKGKSRLGVIYADFVVETDAIIGRVLRAIDESGAADNTLVVFTSDNGCASYIGVPEMEKVGHYPSGPLRGYKTSVWEGGHRVPFLVRWPGVVKPGAVCRQLVLHADLMATLAEILGVALPPNAGEDSFSFLPLLKGGVQPTRTAAVNQSASGIHAVRQGPWKLIFGAEGGPGHPRLQLYNLDDDLGETTNLCAKRPDKVAELTALMKKLIDNGRSTTGPPQPNDEPVRWNPAGRAAAPPKQRR